MNDGTELDAKLIGNDERTDLAVLKVDGKGRKFTYVNCADDNKVRVGDWVVAVGNPVRPRRHGHRRHRFGPRPRYRLRSL